MTQEKIFERLLEDIQVKQYLDSLGIPRLGSVGNYILGGPLIYVYPTILTEQKSKGKENPANCALVHNPKTITKLKNYRNLACLSSIGQVDYISITSQEGLNDLSTKVVGSGNNDHSRSFKVSLDNCFIPGKESLF